MNTRYLTLSAVTAAFLTGPALVEAQKGTGSTRGMARETMKPMMENMSGTVTSIKSGPCEKTTGKAMMGTHLLLETPDKKSVNLHLGPSAAEEVKQILASVKSGSKVEAVAFQTSRLPKDQFIAKSLTCDGKTVELRDDNLRPAWAGTMKSSGRGKGMGQGACF